MESMHRNVSRRIHGAANVQAWLREIDLGILPSVVMPALPQSRISLIRWQSDRGDAKVFKARPLAYDYRLSLLLAPLTTRLWIDGKPAWEGELPAGSFRICPPGVSNEWSRTSGCDIVNLFLPKRLVHTFSQRAAKLSLDVNSDLAKERVSINLSATSFHADRFVVTAVEQLLACQSQDQDSLFCDHLATALTMHVVKHYSERDPQSKSTRSVSPNHERIEYAIDYMEAHLGDELSVSTLAQQASMSVSHFSREFFDIYHQTVHQFLIDRRLQVVRDLLSSSTTPIIQLAVDLGFHDASHLSRAFSQQFGMAPTAYRRLQRTLIDNLG